MGLFRKRGAGKPPACDYSAIEAEAGAASVADVRRHGESGAADACCEAAREGTCCVKVLGTGCKACHTLYENARAAVRAKGLAATVEYVTDMEKITGYGVMRLPALVVNERVVSAGRALMPIDIEKLL